MSEGGWTAAARWRRPPAGGLIVIVIFSNACGAHLLAEGAADDEALAHPQGEVQGGALVRGVRHRIPDLVQPPGLQRYPDGLLQLPVLEAPAPAPSPPHHWLAHRATGGVGYRALGPLWIVRAHLRISAAVAAASCMRAVDARRGPLATPTCGAPQQDGPHSSRQIAPYTRRWLRRRTQRCWA